MIRVTLDLSQELIIEPDRRAEIAAKVSLTSSGKNWNFAIFADSQNANREISPIARRSRGRYRFKTRPGRSSKVPVTAVMREMRDRDAR